MEIFHCDGILGDDTTKHCACAADSSTESPHVRHVPTSVVLETVIITAFVACAFVITKTSCDQLRLRKSRATVVIIGAGPAGLVSAWITAQSGKASRIIVYEDKARSEVVSRTKYLSLDGRSVKFLRSIGLEVTEVVSGSWQHQNFVTTTGLFLAFVLDQLKAKYYDIIDIRFGTKFTKESLKELDSISERIVAIVCDGSGARSASLLGLSDEFTQHSCRSYGAVATIDRTSSPASHPPATADQSAVLPEIRVHHLTIDLNSRCSQPLMQDDPFPTSFHLRIFGCSCSERSLALAVPRCESTIVRSLKVILDQYVMRNIFQECYNKYRSGSEVVLSDSAAVKSLKYSPRLFEIKLLQRMEAAAYIEDADLFVVVEGEAARRVNFESGMGINLVLCGLASLCAFVEDAVWVSSEKMILQTLNAKLKHGRSVSQDFIRHGLKDIMYT